MADPDSHGCELIGRADEIAVLAGLIADLQVGLGHCVLVEGEPGIGKTSVLEAVLARARAAGLAVVHGRCAESGARYLFQVLVECLGLAAEPASVEPSAPTPVLDVADPAAAAVDRVLSDVALRSARGPLLLAIDDLHWADEASLLLWQRLCRNTSSSPLLLVGTCRTGSQRPEVQGMRRVLRAQSGLVLDLPELSAAAVRELAGRLLGARPGPRLAERLESAGGNPHYLRELLDALTRAGAVRVKPTAIAELLEDDGSMSPARVSPVPEHTDAMDEMVRVRLGPLSDAARELLLSAALLGPDLVVTDLSCVLGKAAGALAAPIQEAIAAGVLESSGPRLRFRHRLLRQSLVGSMTAPLREQQRRDALRALIAGGTPAERAAELVLASDAPDRWEIEWAAGQAEALGRKASEVAVRLFEHVLPHAAVGSAERELLLREFAAVCLEAGRYERAAALCREILDVSTDALRRGPAVWILAESLARRGFYEQAERVVEDGISDSGVTELWHVRLVAAAALVAGTRGRYDEASHKASYALAEGERLGDAMSVGYARYAEASSRLLGADLSGCVDAAARGLVSIEGEPWLFDLKLMLYAKQVLALAGLDRFAEAEAVQRNAESFGRRAGPSRAGRYRIMAARLAFQQGRWDEALARLDAAAPDSAPTRVTVLAQSMKALIAAHRDEPHEASLHLEALPAEVRNGEAERFDVGYALLAESVLAERREKPEQALTVLARVLEPARASHEKQFLLLPSLIRVALSLGDGQTADAALRLAQSPAERWAPPGSVAVARWCRGLLVADCAMIAESARYFRSVGRVLDYGHATEDVVVLNCRAGSADAVREELAQVLAVYNGLSATWDIRRLTARLRPLGVRVSGRGAHRPNTGWAALTETEQRIAYLVGEGRANTQVAAALSLSRRTVEVHVSHILAKLGIRSRREVADLLPERPAAESLRHAQKHHTGEPAGDQPRKVSDQSRIVFSSGTDG